MTVVSDSTTNSSTGYKVGDKLKLREIEFPVGTTRRTKDRVNGVAWATLRRGRAKWEGKNLPSTIANYLTGLGYPISNEDARYVMHWVVSHGYGHAKISPVGSKDRTRYIEFGFHIDMDLTKCSPENLKVPDDNGNNAAPVDDGDDVARGVEVLDNVKKGLPAFTPPLPFAPPRAELYRLDELTNRLYDWAEVDAEAYAGWIDSVIGSFSGQ